MLLCASSGTDFLTHVFPPDALSRRVRCLKPVPYIQMTKNRQLFSSVRPAPDERPAGDHKKRVDGKSGRRRIKQDRQALRIRQATSTKSTLPPVFLHSSFYRLTVTPTRSQYAAIWQTLHSGETGLQVVRPKKTRSVLMMIQYLRGSLARSAISVSSGVLVLT